MNNELLDEFYNTLSQRFTITEAYWVGKSVIIGIKKNRASDELYQDITDNSLVCLFDYMPNELIKLIKSGEWKLYFGSNKFHSADGTVETILGYAIYMVKN